MHVHATEAAGILAVVVEHTNATPEDVAKTLGWDVETVSDRLDDLVDQGWLEFWPEEEIGRLPAVTLTPWAAERMGLVLSDRCRWVPAAEDQPPPKVKLKRRTITQTDHDCGRYGSSLNRVVDPRQHEPWVEVAAAEEIAIARDRGLYRGDHGRERLPFPTLLLGQSVTWDGPEITRTRRQCRSCGGRPLKPHVYCLKCDNWGLQRLIPIDVRRIRTRRRRRLAGNLKGGRGA